MKITLADILDITEGKLVGSFQDNTVTITALVDDTEIRVAMLFSPHLNGTKVADMIILITRLIVAVLGAS